MQRSKLRKIRKRFVTDKASNRVAVQIDYNDWLRVERSLNLQDRHRRKTNLSRYCGVISLIEDPLDYQARLRNEWP